jgi:tRNA (mo5U34)-methyltransferase
MGYTEEEKRALIEPYKWYHKIDLGDDVVTPGLDWEHLWENNRKVRQHLDYQGKRVLDIGTWDGLWTFEAEKLGASFVVSTDCQPVVGNVEHVDCWQHALQKFLLVREILGSKALPFFNVTPYNLKERLDVVIHQRHNATSLKFDIIQHLGVLYHLRNPDAALAESRNVIKDNGVLFLETSVLLDEDRSIALNNGLGPDEFNFYNARSNWWCHSVPCLFSMLETAFFEPLEDTMSLLFQHERNGYKIGRVAILCRARPLDEVEFHLRHEMAQHQRNPDFIPYYS